MARLNFLNLGLCLMMTNCLTEVNSWAEASSPMPCIQPQAIIARGSVISSSSRFDEISDGMSLTEILDLLGPAARDVGSGLYVLEWVATDGRVLRASSQSLCRAGVTLKVSR